MKIYWSQYSVPEFDWVPKLERRRMYLKAYHKSLWDWRTWVLFIFGALSLLGGFGRIIGGSPEVELMTAYFGFGVAGLFLSVVTMRIRQKME